MPEPEVAATSVVAVVVTWNRRGLLEESLSAVRSQTHPLAAVVVVDNASTDGTDAFLDAQTGLDVVRLQQNTGGAGGFAVGIEQALTHEPDLVWLLDDDTVPLPGAAAALVRAWRQYDGPRPAVLASKVVWTDGREHPMNTPRRKPRASRAEIAYAQRVGAVPVRSASFVSIMCDAGLVRSRGLPIADYFLWNDDFEYSTRLIRGGVGLHVPASEVVHKTRAFGSTDVDPGERFFYEVRNKVWLFTRSSSLGAGEKVLYGGSSLRRWGRTFARSENRGTLRRAGLRGLLAGLRAAPRANAVVLEEAGWTGPGDTLTPGQPFAVLISTYAGDRPDYLREAFLSTVVEQSRPPAQVVLVQDGPVGEELGVEIRHLVDESPVPVTHVVMEENQGLGPALDAGLRACDHEIVARMDADDVSRPDRFELQIPVIEAGADIVGSGLTEFGDDTGDVVGRRTPPAAPGRDPARGALPRPVQPPHGGLPAQRGARRRRLRAHAPDGGLPAVHADGHRRGAAGQPARPARLLPRRRRRLRAPRAAGRCCAPSSRCSADSASSG